MTLEEQLRRDEGYRQFPYRDSVGKLTIGIGRNLDDVGISELEAEFLLASDIQKVREQLAVSVPWYLTLNEARRGVLENMAFNLGHTGLMKFRRTLETIQAGQHHLASQHMLESLWAKQVGPRASRLAQQMLSGEWV